MIEIMPFILAHPKISIIIISGLVSLFISLINYFVLDKDKVKHMKARQKEIQAQMKEHKHDANKQTELSKELLGHTMENMKHSFKPMLITLVPVLIVFWWIRGIFDDTSIAGSWIWYYIGSAIIFSLIFRKLFKLP